MKNIFYVVFVFISSFISAENELILTPYDFHLKNYNNVAIATDLEPDDVLALKIIFEEANRIFNENHRVNYPINLVIVGEGNTSIKRIRLETMIDNFFNIPEGVQIEIAEGKATANNNFPYDGLELFDYDQLKEIEFKDEDKGAETLLKNFARSSVGRRGDYSPSPPLKPYERYLRIRLPHPHGYFIE